MTSAVDERDAAASQKFQVLLTASLLSSPIVFASNIVAVSPPSIGRSVESVLRCRPVGDQRLRAYPHQRARDRADARRLPRRCRVNCSTGATRSDGPAKSPVRI
jgi:hypothetical protein